jgi:hypothetical protein
VLSTSEYSECTCRWMKGLLICSIPLP